MGKNDRWIEAADTVVQLVPAAHDLIQETQIQCQARRDLVTILNEKLRLNLPHRDDWAVRSLPGVYLPEQEIGITDTRFAGPRTGRIERTLCVNMPLKVKLPAATLPHGVSLSSM